MASAVTYVAGGIEDHDAPTGANPLNALRSRKGQQKTYDDFRGQTA